MFNAPAVCLVRNNIWFAIRVRQCVSLRNADRKATGRIVDEGAVPNAVTLAIADRYLGRELFDVHLHELHEFMQEASNVSDVNPKKTKHKKTVDHHSHPWIGLLLSWSSMIQCC